MISYIGGKYRQAKWIWEIINNHIDMNKIDTYIEPFGGAFWVGLKSPKIFDNYFYNDLNPFMYNLFYSLKNFDKFKEFLLKNEKKYPEQNETIFKQFLKEIFEWKKEFYNKKTEIPNFDIAIKFVYCQTQIFSGVGLKENSKMINLKGKYKTKFAAFKNRIKKEEYRKIFNNLKAVTNVNALDIIMENQNNSNTILYIDPPYFGCEKYYSNHDFLNEENHKKLAEYLNNTKTNWILSYYYFDGIENLYPKNKYIYIEKEYKKIASNNKKKNTGVELLIINKY